MKSFTPNKGIKALFLLSGIILICCQHNPSVVTADVVPDKVDFNFHVKPILSDRCFSCHGPDETDRQAGLRLDLESEAFKALKDQPDKYAIVPGDASQSELVRHIMSDDPSVMMPPPESGLALTETEKEILKKWIEQGAEYEEHWAFIPPEKSPLPEVENSDWPSNEIDYFVLARMNAKGLSPSEETDPLNLLRRVFIDVTGLPPGLDEIEQFATGFTDESYENLVDDLLSRPGYGEKMALYWMDAARYADSYGYQDDEVRSQWPWRDWVIHAFNENMPYDQFIQWQLAGDLLPDATKEQILATGFNRNHKITEEGGVIDEEYRVTYVIDKTNTYSTSMLGITMECAQCHDHRYDPFSQEDYFQLSGFFNNTPEVGIEGTVTQSTLSKYPKLFISQNEIDSLLTFINAPDTGMVTVSVMGDLQDSVRQTYILNRGLYDQRGKPVEADAPEAVLAFDPEKYPRNRLGLAEWTTSPDNPLTARVFVNMIWSKIFGRGIVATVEDFGNQGELPSHPELLDWLAVDFMENGWDVKRLVKQMVMSATYRQSSRMNNRNAELDPLNVYLSRMSRIRMPAESIRDYALTSSGLLNHEIGGPSFKPYQPEGIWEVTSSGRGSLKTYIQDHGEDLYRRGLYVFIKLTVPPPNMLIFDASNRDMCELGRPTTNTPLQALVMMNDPIIMECSRVLSQKILEKELNEEAFLKEAFTRVLCRFPDEKETSVLHEYYQEELQRYQNAPEEADKFIQIGEYPLNEDLDPVIQAALMSSIHLLYNLDETITKT